MLLGQENITYADDSPVQLFYEYNGKIDFLGKGMRSISSAKSKEKCEKLMLEYENLKTKARAYFER